MLFLFESLNKVITNSFTFTSEKHRLQDPNRKEKQLAGLLKWKSKEAALMKQGPGAREDLHR